MAKVVLENVIKKFGGVTAVDNVTLEIGDREFVTLVGPSGCGKTTTLRLIAGLEKVSQGQIYFDDDAVGHAGPPDRAGPVPDLRRLSCQPAIHQ